MFEQLASWALFSEPCKLYQYVFLDKLKQYKIYYMHTSIIISAFFCKKVFPDRGPGWVPWGILTVPSLGHLGDHLSLGWLLHQVSPWVGPSEKLWVFKRKKPTGMAPLSVVRTICCIAWVISRYQWHFLPVYTWDALIWMMFASWEGGTDPKWQWLEAPNMLLLSLKWKDHLWIYLLLGNDYLAYT